MGVRTGRSQSVDAELLQTIAMKLRGQAPEKSQPPAAGFIQNFHGVNLGLAA
jgi:hypothetical protein